MPSKRYKSTEVDCRTLRITSMSFSINYELPLLRDKLLSIKIKNSYEILFRVGLDAKIIFSAIAKNSSMLFQILKIPRNQSKH